MNSERTPYQPISCEFHDRLEDLATMRKRTRIQFRDEDGAQQDRDAVITDVFAHDGEEYVTINTGESVRLDRLLEVDGARLADHEASAACPIAEGLS
ncbi:hypothetical protein AB4Y64_02850 [Lysobacter sp. TAF61]|uniref:hypothetical protein n=1 Tax=Lysobacter sp. TAF61 TaxID=3233072 RepID=UPI003F9CFE0E